MHPIYKARIGLNAQAAPIAEMMLDEFPDVDWSWENNFVLVLSGLRRRVELARRALMFN